MKKFLIPFLFSIQALALTVFPADKVVGDYTIVKFDYHDLVREMNLFQIQVKLSDDKSTAAIVYGETKIEVQADMSFSGQISECHEADCEGISFLQGRVTMVKKNNTFVPQLNVRMTFFSQENDSYKTWVEKYIYRFDGQGDLSYTPTFIQEKIDGDLIRSNAICERLSKGKGMHCSTLRKFRFLSTMNNQSLAILNSYLDSKNSFKKTISVTELRKIMRMNVDSQIFKLRIFGPNLTDKKVAKIKRSMMIHNNKIASLNATNIYVKKHSDSKGKVGYLFLMLDRDNNVAYEATSLDLF